MVFECLRRLPAVSVAAFLALAACGAPEAGSAPEETTATAAADTAGAAAEQPTDAPRQAVGPTTDLPPNEVGMILVLEYHRLGENEGEWIRRPENFWRDLERLYAQGYRPVTMRQVVEGNIDIPAGTSPVVFTIDDSSRGQFYLLEDGSIDPNTMVGMWERFRQENPGWDNGAVWCILPAADHPSNFFGERPSREVPRQQREDIIRRKMQHLVENDHEICNHTFYHERLDRARDDAQAQFFIGAGQDSIKAYLPDDYEIVTFALPLGMWPRNRELAWRGTYRDGRTYQHKAILEVTGGPNVSPFHREFNPRSVNRFIVAPNALERQLDRWEQNPENRYVSDGNPNTIAVPERLADRVDRARWPNKEVRIVRQAAPPAAEPEAATPGQP
jgi:hypothetical protein